MNRIAICVITLVLAVASAAPTTITGVLMKPDGITTYNGGATVYVRTAFTSANGNYIPIGSFKIKFINGVPKTTNGGPLTLEPNIGGTPSGTSYRVTYDITDNLGRQEDTWIVPLTSPATVQSIRVVVVPTPNLLFLPSQINPTGASAGQVITFDGSSVGWGAGGGGGGGTWGTITGTLSSQTDLQAALDAKQALDADLTAIAGLTRARGSLIRGGASAWEAVALGANTRVLKSDGTDAVWGQVAYSELTGTPSTFAPSAHATSHQNGGADEVATATAGANAIPKAGVGGTLAAGWIPDLSSTYEPLDADLTALAGISGLRGDLIRRGASAWERVALGASGRFPKSDGTDVVWSNGGASGIGACTNQFARVLNSDAAPTCETVSLTADVSGILPNGNTTAASANTASAIVARDGSGNFAASTITASLTGTASAATLAAAATALATPRAIYGNNFDGTAALTQIIASTYGGTGNGFAKFSGPATTEKTFTLPNSSETLLYAGGALGTPASGTLTNATGLPIAGITGLGSNVATLLATFSSANQAAALTDETGLGPAVFANNPQLGNFASGSGPTSATIVYTTDNPLSSSATTVNVNQTTGFPSAGILILRCNSIANQEYVSYTGITATSFTGLTRGLYGTSAASKIFASYVCPVDFIHAATTGVTPSIVSFQVGSVKQLYLGNSNQQFNNETVSGITLQAINSAITSASFYLTGGIFSSFTGYDTYLRTASGRTINIGDNQAQTININSSTGNTLVNGASLQAKAYVGIGSAPTVDATSCTGATIGTGAKNTAGTITGLPTGACSVVLTFTGYTATTGWSCEVSDRTTGNLFRQTAASTTTATFGGTSVSGDVLSYLCAAY